MASWLWVLLLRNMEILLDLPVGLQLMQVLNVVERTRALVRVRGEDVISDKDAVALPPGVRVCGPAGDERHIGNRHFRIMLALAMVHVRPVHWSQLHVLESLLVA